MSSARTIGNPRYSSVTSKPSTSLLASVYALMMRQRVLTQSTDTPPFIRDTNNVLRRSHHILRNDVVVLIIYFRIQERVIPQVDPDCRSCVIYRSREKMKGLTFIESVLTEVLCSKFGDHHCRPDVRLDLEKRRMRRTDHHDLEYEINCSRQFKHDHDLHPWSISYPRLVCS